MDGTGIDDLFMEIGRKIIDPNYKFQNNKLKIEKNKPEIKNPTPIKDNINTNKFDLNQRGTTQLNKDNLVTYSKKGGGCCLKK